MCSGKLSAIQLLKFSVIWTVNLTKQFFLLIVINVSLVMLLVENNFNSVCECKYTQSGMYYLRLKYRYAVHKTKPRLLEKNNSRLFL